MVAKRAVVLGLMAFVLCAGCANVVFCPRWWKVCAGVVVPEDPIVQVLFPASDSSEYSNGHYPDSSGNGVYGTNPVAGTRPTWNSVTNALRFTGGDFIDFPTIGSFMSGATGTVAGWVTHRDYTDSTSIMLDLRSDEADDFLFFGYEIETPFPSANKLQGRFAAGASTQDIEQAYSQFTYQDGVDDETWVHVVVCWESGGNITLYTNQALALTHGSVMGAWSGTATNLRIGAWNTGTYPWQDGFIDDVFVYDRALSHTEVSNLYSATAAGHP